MPSTAISRISYDTDTETLTIGFVTNGRVYDYFGVPPEIHAAFRLARSKGAFFNRNIRDHFLFELVYDPAEPHAASGARQAHLLDQR